jgi:hypothetical protein
MKSDINTVLTLKVTTVLTQRLTGQADWHWQGARCAAVR